jgi:hypothetical protein
MYRHLKKKNQQNAVRDLRSSGILYRVAWQLVTDVSGQPVVLVFEGQAVQEEGREHFLPPFPLPHVPIILLVSVTFSGKQSRPTPFPI